MVRFVPSARECRRYVLAVTALFTYKQMYRYRYKYD
jgi:hypothetical protein